jgi:hypothetical protein
VRLRRRGDAPTTGVGPTRIPDQRHGRSALVTDAGMLALWAPEPFAGVTGHDAWEAELLEDEDLTRHIAAGHLVPLNVGADGAYGVAVRTGSVSEPAMLTEREFRYLYLTSEPYLLVSSGRAVVSGIEHVSGDARYGHAVAVPAGRWSVTVSVLDWELEPDAVDVRGRPAPSALPDFAVLLNPERGSAATYRTSLYTFEADV